MFGASHFQKEWNKNIVFWVSYSKNKFLTTNWLQQLTNTTYWLQIDWIDKHYKLDYKLIDFSKNWQMTTIWQTLQIDQNWKMTNDSKLT
jgi:hypothetical protein